MADELHREQTPEEQVANELHVGQHLLLHPLHLEEQLLRGLEGRGQALEVVLARAEQKARERPGLFAFVLWRELGVSVLESEHHVGIGFAQMRLLQRLLEDDGEDKLQLLGVVQLLLGQAVDDGLEVVGRDPVEQRPDLSLDLLLARERLGVRELVALVGHLEAKLLCHGPVLFLIVLRIAGLRRPRDLLQHHAPGRLQRRSPHDASGLRPRLPEATQLPYASWSEAFLFQSFDLRDHEGLCIYSRFEAGRQGHHSINVQTVQQKRYDIFATVVLLKQRCSRRVCRQRHASEQQPLQGARASSEEILKIA
mmetsp:Transcript_136223/g.435826  ORF Transcript_136223/g.435826 Transcript_136223/m.435826 type:complete len:310 (+) Transcript_136223:1361-2290(+)